ncbi:hypothetical protein M426DRAFT_319343 [Hypoxylon sp. CI-4A]|nr:hypothetical protein M426DRAFT_319343 [Hypoxylon sp. CI-4A]
MTGKKASKQPTQGNRASKLSRDYVQGDAEGNSPHPNNDRLAPTNPRGSSTQQRRKSKRSNSTGLDADGKDIGGHDVSSSGNSDKTAKDGDPFVEPRPHVAYFANHDYNGTASQSLTWQAIAAHNYNYNQIQYYGSAIYDSQPYQVGYRMPPDPNNDGSTQNFMTGSSGSQASSISNTYCMPPLPQDEHLSDAIRGTGEWYDTTTDLSTTRERNIRDEDVFAVAANNEDDSKWN